VDRTRFQHPLPVEVLRRHVIRFEVDGVMVRVDDDEATASDCGGGFAGGRCHRTIGVALGH